MRRAIQKLGPWSAQSRAALRGFCNVSASSRWESPRRSVSDKRNGPSLGMRRWGRFVRPGGLGGRSPGERVPSCQKLNRSLSRFKDSRDIKVSESFQTIPQDAKVTSW